MSVADMENDIFGFSPDSPSEDSTQLSPCIFDVLRNAQSQRQSDSMRRESTTRLQKDRVEAQSRTASHTESDRINKKRPVQKALFTSTANSGMTRARDQRIQATSARCSSQGQEHSQQKRPSTLTEDRVEAHSRTASHTESDRINKKRPVQKALFTSTANSGMTRARDQRIQATSARCSSQGQEHSQQKRPSTLTGERVRRTSDNGRSTQEQANSGMHRERALGHSHTAATTAVIMEQTTNEDLINEMKSLKDEVHCLKRSISQLTEQQGELFRMVKSLRKTSEASHFDMGKCCHTENVNRILAQFYCTNGRYPIATDDKKKLLEEEFLDSASGLTVDELMLRVTKYESTKYSYWRSEERRRVLGINGYEHLVKASSSILAKKVVQLLGQKHNAVATSTIKKDIILIRKFMREASEDEAKQLKDFWGAFYRWKNDTMPQHLSFEDWEEMREEDMNFYPED